MFVQMYVQTDSIQPSFNAGPEAGPEVDSQTRAESCTAMMVRISSRPGFCDQGISQCRITRF